MSGKPDPNSSNPKQPEEDEAISRAKEALAAVEKLTSSKGEGNDVKIALLEFLLHPENTPIWKRPKDLLAIGLSLFSLLFGANGIYQLAQAKDVNEETEAILAETKTIHAATDKLIKAAEAEAAKALALEQQLLENQDHLDINGIRALCTGANGFSLPGLPVGKRFQDHWKHYLDCLRGRTEAPCVRHEACDDAFIAILQTYPIWEEATGGAP